MFGVADDHFDEFEVHESSDVVGAVFALHVFEFVVEAFFNFSCAEVLEVGPLIEGSPCVAVDFSSDAIDEFDYFGVNVFARGVFALYG